MVGDKYPCEMRAYTDRKSGLTVRQLTRDFANEHLYFTDNSFDSERNEIIFFSSRPHGGRVMNLFRMDLCTGEMTQLTDVPGGITVRGRTKTPDSEYVAYTVGDQIRVLHTPTLVERTIYEDPGMDFWSLSISPDKRLIGFTRNEKVQSVYGQQRNYGGFKEKMFDVKDGRVSVMNLDGTGFRDVYRDTHWVGHFQFSPDDANIAMYCHEGPWNYVQQRIWLIEIESGAVRPCFRQQEDDCVGHEFWTRDGYVLFDNRRKGHDGTITSDKTQAVAPDLPTDQIPYFGFADKRGEVVRTVEMPFYCNHYHANSDNSLFVGDAVEDIVLIDPTQSPAELRVLAGHNTSWRYQRSHPHPTFSWDDRQILFAADTDDGPTNLFLIDLAENGLLKEGAKA